MRKKMRDHVIAWHVITYIQEQGLVETLGEEGAVHHMHYLINHYEDRSAHLDENLRARIDKAVEAYDKPDPARVAVVEAAFERSPEDGVRALRDYLHDEWHICHSDWATSLINKHAKTVSNMFDSGEFSE